MHSVFNKAKSLIFMLVLILLFITIGSIMIVVSVRNSERESADIIFENVAIQSELMVKYLKESINKFEAEKRKSSDAKVKELTQVAIKIYENYYDKYKKGEYTEAEALSKANAKVRSLKFGNGGYYFAMDSQYNMLVYGADPSKEGSPVWKDMKDKDNVYFIKEMLQNAISKGEHYQDYWWRTNVNEDYKIKRSYVAQFKPWNLVVGTGVYDDTEKEIQDMKQSLINDMESTIINIKVGKSGYPYVVDDNGNMIMYFNKELKKVNFNDYKDKKTGQSLMTLLNESKKNKKYEFEYYWNKPNSSEIQKKIVIVKYDPELKWNIVLSAYENELYEGANKTQTFLILISLSVFFLVILAFTDSIKLISNLKN